MRTVAIILSAIVLSGCAQLSALNPLRGGATEVAIPAAEVATQQVTIPALGARGFVTQSAQNDGVVTWKTADNTTFSFRQGVIVSTRGLGDDLMGADVGQTLAALRGGAEDWGPRVHGYMNAEYQSYFMSFQCRRTASDRDNVQIGDRIVSATRTTETCLNDEIQIENAYWRNGNGVMVKSRQWVSPGVGYMETERAIR